MMWKINEKLKELENKEKLRETTEKIRRKEIIDKLERTKNNCTKVYTLLSE